MYVRGELSGEELSEFQAHLNACAHCREQVCETRRLIRQLERLPSELMKRDLAHEILARIPEEAWGGSARRPLRWRRYLLAATAAAACLLMALSLVELSGGRTHHAVMPEEVTRALDWLAATQEPDGGWAPHEWGGQKRYAVGLTGLAVLALVGSEESPHCRAVEKAAAYLLREQRANGRFGPRFSSDLYNHGIATVALLEVYGANKSPDLKAPIDRSVEYIKARQNENGGWGYSNAGPRSVNTSISSWQLHALLLAGALGWEGSRASSGRGLAWLKTMVDDEGRVGYARPRDFPYGSDTLIGAAALCLSAGGETEEVGGRMARSLTRAASAESETDYYRSYFLTYALHAVEEDRSENLTQSLLEALRESQVRTGPGSGSWEPDDRWSSAGGRVYATAMSALSLEANRRVPLLLGRMKGVLQ